MEFKDTVTLGELSIDGKGNYGIGASAVEFQENLPTYLRITDISEDGYLLKDSLKSLDDLNAEKYKLKPNDIVFARTGNSTGKSYFYDGTDGELIYAGFLIKFSLDESKVNPKFIRYYTLSEEYKGWIKGFSTGSTRGNINAKSYANMQIKLPSREYQDFIVNILSSFEAKYKLNNSLILNLEEMTHTLFKRWFIDFEFPNENGEPYKSSDGEMIENEKELIPKGWDMKTIGNISERAGNSINVEKLEKVIPYIGLEHMPRGSIALSSWETSEKISSNKTSFQKGDILFGKLRPYFKKVGFAPVDGICSTDIVVFNSKKPHYYSFLMCVVSRDDFIDYCNASATGTRMPRTGWNQMIKYSIAIPPEEVAKQFNEYIKSFYEKINELIHENINLKSLRDTLLPKLLSQEVELPSETEVTEHVQI